MLEIQTTIKQSIFKPLFMNFPVLDKYPALFPSRRRAFSLVDQFEKTLYELIQSRPGRSMEEKLNPDKDQVVHMLERALKEGRITEKQYRDNLKITFIVAHENSQLLLNSMFHQIGANKVSSYLSPSYITSLGIDQHLSRKFKPNYAKRSTPPISKIQPLTQSTNSPT